MNSSGCHGNLRTDLLSKLKYYVYHHPSIKATCSPAGPRCSLLAENSFLIRDLCSACVTSPGKFVKQPLRVTCSVHRRSCIEEQSAGMLLMELILIRNADLMFNFHFCVAKLSDPRHLSKPDCIAARRYSNIEH